MYKSKKVAVNIFHHYQPPSICKNIAGTHSLDNGLHQQYITMYLDLGNKCTNPATIQLRYLQIIESADFVIVIAPKCVPAVQLRLLQ